MRADCSNYRKWRHDCIDSVTIEKRQVNSDGLDTAHSAVSYFNNLIYGDVCLLFLMRADARILENGVTTA